MAAYVNSIQSAFSTSGTGSVSYSFTVNVSYTALAGDFLVLGEISDLTNDIIFISGITDDGGNTWIALPRGSDNSKPDTWYAASPINPTTVIHVTFQVQGALFGGTAFSANGTILIGEYSSFTFGSASIIPEQVPGEVHYPYLSPSTNAYLVGIALQNNVSSPNPFAGPDVGGTVRQTAANGYVNYPALGFQYFGNICLVDQMTLPGYISQTLQFQDLTRVNQSLQMAYVASNPTTPSCQLAATPTSLSFSAAQCETGVGTQTLTIVDLFGGAIPFTISATQPWLTLSATSGTTPATIQVGINTLNLAGGTYADIISITSASCGNPTVAVSLTITVPTCPYPLSAALTTLSDRLYDTNNQFWTVAELTIYIQEAMREWNAFTGYWRGDFLFNAVAGTLWYDITDPAVAPNSLRLPTFTDATLMTEMQYHLLEPPVGVGLWTGSNQFNIADMTSAVLRRRDEVLGITGCQILRILVPAVPGRTFLPLNVVDLRRVAFIPAAGQGSPTVLWQDDRWSWQTFEPLYTQAPRGTPNTWSVSTQPFLTFDVDVQPGVPGQYELLVIQAASPIPFQCATFPLLLPDDWAWVIKWGALSDLLGRESNAKDELRQKYAEGRYKQGCALLTAAPAVLGLRLNNLNLTLQLDSVKSADDYNPTWEGQAPAQPQEALTAGLNLLALVPAPDAGTYSLMATVIENTPVPVNPGDCINVPRDIFDVIIDEAQHLAAFKMGGAEFLATMPQHERFMQLASLYSSRLNEQGTFTQILFQQSQLEAEFDPRYSADLDPAAGAEG
jgi:hypothetical protein